jgi:tetratricopeptide (TPR) repeat protein/serine phosphatase RsbU (regulator of sigma subunit)
MIARVLMLCFGLLSVHLAAAQTITADDLEGIFYGELREGYSRHSKCMVFRFYRDGSLIATEVPGQPYDLKNFAQQFSRESQARFDQGKYQLIGNVVEYTMIATGRRMYFKGTATNTNGAISLSLTVKDLQSRAEYTMVCKKLWPVNDVAAVTEEKKEDPKDVVENKTSTVTDSEKKTDPKGVTDQKGKQTGNPANKASEKLDNLIPEQSTESTESTNEEEQKAIDEALLAYGKEYDRFAGANDAEGAARAMNNIGATQFRARNYERALNNFREALVWKTVSGDKKGMATLNNNMAVCYERLNQREAAIEQYEKAAALYTEAGASGDAARMMYQIAVVEKNHMNGSGEQEALQKLIETEKTLGNNKELSATYNNLAVSYFKSRQFDKALEVLEEGIRIDESTDYTYGLAVAYNNRGNVRFEQGQTDQSLADYRKALGYKQAIGDARSTAITLYNIGNVFAGSEQIDSARAYYDRSLDLAEKAGDIQVMHANYRAISALLSTKDGCAEPLEYYKLYASLRFSVNENKELKQLCEEREKYILEQFSKNASLSEDLAMLEELRTEDLFAINLLQEDLRRERHQSALEIETRQQEIALLSKDKQLLEVEKGQAEAESEKKTYLLVGAGAAGLLVMGLLLQAVRSARRARRDKALIAEQKKQVEGQKELVEEKNKEILDSITYARRLQTAILPPAGFIQSLLTDSFLMYQPKDIVAGDFYWVEKMDRHIYFAVADCTGHGVPGAMVSVVCSNALERAVREFQLRETGQILDKVRELVIDTFRKSEDQVKDGMDIALCRYDTLMKELQFSGANNPLWVVRKRVSGENIDKELVQSETHYILETKADKQPVGQHTAQVPFTTHRMQLRQDDTIILFSDGYADQFGGEKGKKLKLFNLKQIIFANHTRGMKHLHTTLVKEFDRWKGDFEQIDDVCIMGVRV